MRNPVSARQFEFKMEVYQYIASGTLGIMLAFLVAICMPYTNLPSEIWYISGVEEIDTVNPATAQRKIIVPSQPDILLGAATFSPDHTHIAYGSGQISSYAIWLTNLNGTNPRKISGDFLAVNFFWLDHQNLVIMGSNHNRTWPEDGEWWLYNLSTQRLQRMIPSLNHYVSCLQMAPATMQTGRVPFPGGEGILTLGNPRQHDSCSVRYRISTWTTSSSRLSHLDSRRTKGCLHSRNNPRSRT